jgi:RimJ/RimL family protein N-acetyltransferase
MKPYPTHTTERLVLRRFELADAADVQRLAGERAIADTTTNIPHPYADGVAEAWIAGHQAMFDSGQWLALAVTRKSDGALLGAISLMRIVEGHQAELGYWIGKPYWSLGYCTEAARALVHYAFAELGLLRVHATHFARNPASGQVMEKLGMRREGCRRRHIMKWGVPEDMALYGLLRHEWEQGGGEPSIGPGAFAP